MENQKLIGNPSSNPYRFSAATIINRLAWDLKIQSWRSRKKLQKLRNQYCTQKAVILCNGPSLLKSDLHLLDNVFTFGLNKINLLFEKSSFRPSCIVSVNPLVLEQNADFYNKTSIPLFLDSAGTNIVRSRENVVFLHSSMQSKFSRDVSISLFYGYTVTYVAMQLAYHMGFEKVALIGCDHNFSTKGVANSTVVAGSQDKNHFDPKYFADGVKWQLPDLAQSESAYAMAKNAYELTGRHILNATEGGCLEMLPRVSLSEFVKEK
ncbi:MAG: DUF115 domain-containing protein [Leptolyngbyaceae cyanobacterium SU_3_3]|nr:DUF115 domain-containing protein [Leptolyngbyaceae cyanobacterium SU_3_3]